MIIGIARCNANAGMGVELTMYKHWLDNPELVQASHVSRLRSFADCIHAARPDSLHTLGCRWPPSVLKQLRDRSGALFARIERTIGSMQGATYHPLGKCASVQQPDIDD